MAKRVRPDRSEQTDSTFLSSLQQFAEASEDVAATTKKLEKAALLADYFKDLSDLDLARAARYFAGQQFAMNDSRTTNVGGSIISGTERSYRLQHRRSSAALRTSGRCRRGRI